MKAEIIVAILSLIGTLAGSFFGICRSNSLTIYRLKELEKKVAKHNCLIERVYKLEAESKAQHDDIEVLQRHDEEHQKNRST